MKVNITDQTPQSIIEEASLLEDLNDDEESSKLSSQQRIDNRKLNKSGSKKKYTGKEVELFGKASHFDEK